LVHADIAFACAVDPEAVNMPLAHWLWLGGGAAADPADPPELELLLGVVLLLVPQAPSASTPAVMSAPAPTRRVGLNTGTDLLLS